MELPAFLAAFLAGCTVLTGAEITVAPDARGGVAALQTAIDATRGSDPTVIRLQPGTYTGHVVIPAGLPPLTLRGSDAATTVITDDKNVNSPDGAGKPLGHTGAATVHVAGNDVTLEGLTCANTAGRQAHQAPALAIKGDRFIARHCRMLGWQDTVLADAGREYWEDCTISGHCDFIYGSAAAWFERCTIIQRADGYVTAASTARERVFGYVFNRCRVEAEPAVKSFVLGRPWRPYASTLFMHCGLPAVLRPEGWFNWDHPEREKTARYAEYRNTGPGADTAKRVPWSRQLGDDEAQAVTITTVLGGGDGWDPRKSR